MPPVVYAIHLGNKVEYPLLMGIWFVGFIYIAIFCVTFRKDEGHGWNH